MQPVKFKVAQIDEEHSSLAIVRDGTSLIHANAFHMAVAIEPIAAAIARIRAAGSELAGVRRLAR